MNAPIRRVSVVILLMFLALLINSSYAYVFRSDSLTSDPQNRRVRDAQFGTHRGDILVGNTPIVTSSPVDDRFGFQRVYEQPTLYAGVTGHYSFVYGGTGLEQFYSEQLSGTSDAQALQRILDAATGKKQPGASLQTTLDARAQKAAADGLGSKPGAVVAIDYTTGAVKALVTTPSYDPNALASHDLNATQEAWAKLSGSSSKPLANRATREIYQPGSTFKVIVAAAALAEGKTPDSMIDAPVSLTYPGSSAVLNNAGSCGDTSISLRHALQVSCNTAFALLGDSLGQDKVRAQAEKFGFGRRILPELNAVASLFPDEPMDRAAMMMSSIGTRDVRTTPLQMALVAAGVANDGIVMEPYLVEKIVAADLNVISQKRPSQMSVAMSANNAEALQDMMVNVVNNGTGRRAQVTGVRVGGKTGTAVVSQDQAPYAWFVAFAEKPNIAVAVFVQDAGVDSSGVSGSRYAAPIAKSVIESMR